MARISIEFDGFNDAIKRFEEMEKDLKPVIEKMMKEVHREITPGIKSSIASHHLTGATEESLRQTPEIKWNGLIAEMGVGFNIAEGGLPSVFLMYGTPKMRPDMKLWNAFFGSTVKKRIEETQQRVATEEFSL